MTHTYRRLWLAALAVFVLAGATGAFLRFGTIYGMGGLQFSNVRHAHSHLMYFGWVTPALMAVIAAWLPRMSERPLSGTFRRTIVATIILGLVAYLPFLFFGYRSATIASAELPLSVMAAGLNVVAWYVFTWQYRRETRSLPRVRPLQLWDAALIFLLAATLGAAGLPVVTFLGVQDPFWSTAFAHIFLDLFAEGWFVLAILGVAYAAAGPAVAAHPWVGRSTDLIILGLPLIFLLGMPTYLVPTPVRWLAGAGGALVAIGLLGHARVLWQAGARQWRAPLAFLVLKALGLFAVAIPYSARWAELNRLRVPYLHWLLLGFVTLSLFAAAQDLWSEEAVPGRRAMTVAVVILVLSLIPLTGIWPGSWSGRWVLHFAAWAALGPVLVAIGVLARQWLGPGVSTGREQPAAVAET